MIALTGSPETASTAWLGVCIADIVSPYNRDDTMEVGDESGSQTTASLGAVVQLSKQ